MTINIINNIHDKTTILEFEDLRRNHPFTFTKANDQNETVLYRATHCKNLPLIQHIISQGGKHLIVFTPNKMLSYSPLGHAIVINDTFLVKMFIRLGADIESPMDIMAKWTPLRFAVAINKFAVAQLLYAYGAKLEKSICLYKEEEKLYAKIVEECKKSKQPIKQLIDVIFPHVLGELIMQFVVPPI